MDIHWLDEPMLWDSYRLWLDRRVSLSELDNMTLLDVETLSLAAAAWDAAGRQAERTH